MAEQSAQHGGLRCGRTSARRARGGGPRRHPRRATMLCILGISTPADFDSSFAPVEYTLSSLPPKLLMANKRPPPDAVIDGHAAEATLPDHFRQVKLSNISLVAYHSSELEQRWIDTSPECGGKSAGVR